jgi:FAD:protein FMN transferase
VTHPNRRDVFRAGAVGLGSAALASVPRTPSTREERSFHFDHILGTSLDGWVVGPVEQAEAAALNEIERLRKVFSLHDTDSELSRLNRASGSFSASADLLDVLRVYETWGERTGGAMNPQVGGLVRAWDTANGTEPDAAALARAVKRIQTAGWTVDGNTVTRHSDQPLNLNSIAKGYILQQAAAAMKQVASAGLLNLGGDIVAWGEQPTTLGVQDPFSPFDNASPLRRITICNQAVATSGGYLRTYTTGGQKHSHILDPRTGRPADSVAQATVIAADSTTANVLATTLCVLDTVAGLKLAASMNAAALIIDANGREHRSANFASYELPVGADEKKPEEKKPEEKKKDEPKGDPWPEEYEVTLSFELPTPGGKARRPYVAFWIENADGKAVRTVAVWGNSPKWLNTMSGWWKLGKDDKDLCKAVCRATRAPGKYDLVWDGKDDAGKALPQGTYTIKLEVHREHGKDVTQTAKIKCLAEADKATMEKNAEAEESTLKYAKKEKKKEKDK